MATLKQIVEALREKLPDICVDGLEAVNERRIFGIVVDKAFAKLDYPERQQIIRDALESKFCITDLALVGPIAALSPDEAELRSADVA